jgi:aspartyl-tRNA(Asn)/glutamyl-tRNA(Gln) amidotransferase subunit C
LFYVENHNRNAQVSLDLDAVRRIARLARLEVTDAESVAVRDQLNGILHLVGELQAADTAGVEPMSHARDLTLRLRADEVTETDRSRAFQAVAPQVEDGLYLVPRVVE